MARVYYGRRKIAMKKITSQKHLQVTFSKRRCGLFKKASELCILTGAKVSVIVFSPGGKPFSFGHPNVSAVTDRFCNGRPLPDTNNQGPYGAAISSLYQQHNELCKRLEAEKKRGKELDRIWAQTKKHSWLTQPIDELNIHQLRIFKAHLLNFREKIDEVLLKRASTSTPSANPSESFDLNVANPVEMEGSV